MLSNKQKPLKLFDAVIQPGERAALAMPMPELFSCAPLYMPIQVMRGRQPGPCVLITAAIYGNEFNGTEIIHRLMNMSMLKRLKGTIIAVPVVNVFGLINRDRYFPGGIDLERHFPGSKTGSHVARFAHLLATEVVDQCDICVDLKTGFLNCLNLPQVYVNFKDAQAKQLAEAFGAPVIASARCEKGTLGAYVAEQNKPFLMYEAGEAMRYDHHAIKTGVHGLLRVLRHLSMLPTKAERKEKMLKPVYAHKNSWLRAPTSGVSQSKHQLGQHVQKGDLLCRIADPFGTLDPTPVYAPDESIIVGKNNLPLVHEGEGLFQLAMFRKMEQAADHLEDWQDFHAGDASSEPNTQGDV